MFPVAPQHIFSATRNAPPKNETDRDLQIVSIQAQTLLYPLHNISGGTAAYFPLHEPQRSNQPSALVLRP
jgi:hypothetical protein